MWAKIITIKRTKDLNYFSLCALNLFNTQVSQIELNYWNKWTFHIQMYWDAHVCVCVFCGECGCICMISICVAYNSYKAIFITQIILIVFFVVK